MSYRHRAAVLFAAFLLPGCTGSTPAPAPAPSASSAAAAASAEDLMKSGLDALYKKQDANAAAATFRQVLQLNPTHYGATYQLATALDQAGKGAEARPYWQKVLEMARGYNDQPVVDKANQRLQSGP